MVRLHTIGCFPVQSANEHLPTSRDHTLASYLLSVCTLKTGNDMKC